MKIGIMQPYFFPYIGYWQLLNAVDKYVIYDDVNYIKGGWINRNRILMNDEAIMINLRMNGASPNKLINEVEVACDILYNKKLLRKIESCYSKAPYYSNVLAVLENIINKDEKNLAKYLEYSIRQICDYLLIDTEIIVSSTLIKNNDLRGQEKVLEICKVLRADEYYNSIGGQELYSFDDFSSQGIKLKFLKTGIVEYHQFSSNFVPNLSMLDVLMFNSIEEIKNKLEIYEIIQQEGEF